MKHILLTAAVILMSVSMGNAEERTSAAAGIEQRQAKILSILKRQIPRCLRLQIPFHPRGATMRAISVTVYLNSDGSLSREPKVMQPGRNKILEDRVVLAIKKCAPFKDVRAIAKESDNWAVQFRMSF